MKKMSKPIITRKRLKEVKNSIHIGETINVPKNICSGTTYGASNKPAEVIVVAKYDNYVLVKNIVGGDYKWAINYIDLLYVTSLINDINDSFVEEG